MPRITKPPAYRLYKRTGDAVVTLNGRDHYLGKYGSRASQETYDRLVGEWLTNGRRIPLGHQDDGLTVSELIAAYWSHCRVYYHHAGELGKIRLATRTVRRLYGRSAVQDFGPLALKAIRQVWVSRGIGRDYVNDQVGRIKRMFRWGVESEIVPARVFHALQAISGLRRGRTEALEGQPVRPVPTEHVDAIRRYVSQQVWAIIELQRLTGMRSGEVIIMRGRDLDTTGPIWFYRPGSHKTQHYGHERVVEIGPRAQEVIRPFLKPDLMAYLFSPADAEVTRRAELHRKRKTAMSCGNRPGTNRKRKPKRTPRERYTPDSYRRAITRGCDHADLAAKKRRGLPPDNERMVPRWHPHQLRHNFATEVRKQYGIEVARILLGHRSAVVTEIYAEADRTKAREIMAKIG